VERAVVWDNRVQQKVLEAVEDAAVQMEKRLIEAAFNRMLAEVENGMGDWRAALETLKRRKSLEWGDNVSIRADKRAAELIAALLREEATGDNQTA
jgi:phage terminase small subunit